MPSDVDKAYAAGVMDSEGTMGIYLIRSGNAKGSPFTRVSIGTQDTELLLWFQQEWGGKVEWHSGTNVNKWVAHTIGIRKQFLIDLLPYMRTKKAIAELILQHLDRTQRGGSYEEIAAECKRLNHLLSTTWRPWVKELSTDKQGNE